jgi:uncharacterized protein YndB with AHSA1/START domain
MGTDSIEVTAVIPASPEQVYAAWLDSEGHTAMTGGGATVEPFVGGDHTAGDGYISGKTLALEVGRRIEQSWYAADFPEGSAHSQIVVTIEPEGESTRVHIAHREIPEGMGKSYESGWQEHYFTPMMAYFETGGAEASAKKKAPARKAAAKKKAPARKAAAKKPAAKKSAKKAAKRPAARKSAKKKAAAKRPAAKKSVAKKAAAKKPAAKKSVAKKAAAKKPAAKKSAKKKAAKRPVAKKSARKKAAAKRPAAKKAAAKKSARKKKA